MNWLTVGKTAVSFITSLGVGVVITNVVKATTPKNGTIINQVLIGVGSFVLSGMVAEIASDYVNKEIDGLISSVKREPIP